MVSFRFIALTGALLLSAFYGMPEKFGRDPASLSGHQRSTKKSSQELNAQKAPRLERRVSRSASSVKTAPVIQVPSLEGRNSNAPQAQATSRNSASSPILIEADGFKESLQRKIASDARWTRYFQGDSIKDLADCTVDAGRRTLDDRQIESQISEAGSDAHRSLMFCAVRIKSALVAAAKKNGTATHQAHSSNASPAPLKNLDANSDSSEGESASNSEQHVSVKPGVLPAEQAEEVLAANVTFEPVNEAVASSVENN